jgi:AraC-like DNA-binding protein
MFLRQLMHLLKAEQPGRNTHLEYVLAADAYIQSNLHRNITIKEICEAVGLYETALKQAFTNYFGKGMIGRHQDLRIEKAKQLLQYTQKSIGAIIVECGYGSENSFRQNFDNATGESPNLWRKKMKK